MKPLTPAGIARFRSNESLQVRLGAEIERLIGGTPGSAQIGTFLRSLRSLPPGLRAMAATYELDVSMALDGLEDHFVNWHSKALAQETLRGLRTLGARQEGEVFARALRLALSHWSSLGSGVPARGTALYKQFDPLNIRLWHLLGYQGNSGRSLLALWAPYARAHPEEVCART
jgi:hypothetical protein